MTRRLLALILLVMPLACIARTQAEPNDTIVPTVQKKKTFWKKVIKPFKWIGKNWSAYDPRYSTPSFYNWVVQLQNTSSNEWVSLSYDDFKINMRSKLSNKIGPHLGYSFLFYGWTFDLNALKGTKNRNEFTISINSNLVNIDIIRRRTGGDFMIRNINYFDNQDASSKLSEIYNMFHVGDDIRYGIDGVNINYFTNHRKYSNPAAFSNGAIQLRSAGSPMIGLGYTRQFLHSGLSDLFARKVFGNEIFESKDNHVQEAMIEKLYDSFTNIYDNNDDNLFTRFSSSISPVPSNIKIDDWHLQLGYAYNVVFSRRLLFGISAVVSPGIKWVRCDNENSFIYKHRKPIATGINDILSWYFPNEFGDNTFHSDDFVISNTSVSFGANIFGRASLTYNHNRWRAGVNINANAFLFNKDKLNFNNAYGSATIYVGYCFGRKKEYRHDGANRQAYITAALTPSQIVEMNDTLPHSNIRGTEENYYTRNKIRKNTKYHNDKVELKVDGCDLVKGEDGKYGTYEITDGFVTDANDTKGLLAKGTVLDIDKDGKFVITAPHDNGFRTGNWWKAHLDVNQTTNNWYPEMLHYALKGRLSLNVRGRIFGTKKPVTLVIDDFFINHGTEAQQFLQIGAEDFESKSTYSIVGDVKIGNRTCRVYIEHRKHGSEVKVFVNRIHPSMSKWMSGINDSCAVSRISMPGTHDSGSSSLPESAIYNTAHTQNFTPAEQLRDGIRCFDIRLKKNLNYGHTLSCRQNFANDMIEWDKFLTDNPSEVIVALIGSDEGGKWGEELTKNYKELIKKYQHRFVENFSPSTSLGEVRGKILVIRRQEECPYGRLLKFEDNTVFDYDCFHVEDVYKAHKTWKKAKLVEKNIREAYENEDPNKWYLTFNSVAWDPRHHQPYRYAWGTWNIRKPLNAALRETIELKDYSNFGMVFLDFYNDHGERPQLVESIIKSNFSIDMIE